MANDYANTPKIDGFIRGLIKERRLKNTGRKVNVVIRGAVVGIYGGRAHTPFVLVERFADLVPIAFDFKGASTLRVTQEIIPLDDHGAVVAPLVRIADFVSDRLQFDFRLGFG